MFRRKKDAEELSCGFEDRIVSEAINKLPDQMKAIMQLSLEGKKNAEIADRLNISTETVHTLKKIAYKKLRENLKDYYYFLLFFI